MASLRAVAQRPIGFFLDEDARGTFKEHNLQNGVGDNCPVYRSDDYANLFNLVTHSDRRAPLDIVTKYIIAGVLLSCLKGAGYFSKPGWVVAKEELLIGERISGFVA